MDVRDKIEAWRNKHHIKPLEAAQRLRISEELYLRIIFGDVTHPKIARYIQKAIGLSEAEYNELIPENHREGPNYDPEKYVEKFNPKPGWSK